MTRGRGLARIDWRELWETGGLGRFCFISLGILLHVCSETMIGAIMPKLVKGIGGVQLVGWSFAMYELGAILAGAAGGQLVMRHSVRTTMIASALTYAFGCLICAVAPSMTWMLAGRLIQGFGGGSLVALAFIAVERYFPNAIWPQLFAILSAIWGVGAFIGPLSGALIESVSSWRGVFLAFAGFGLFMAALSGIALRSGESRPPPQDEGKPFPFVPLLILAAGVTLISWAGIERSLIYAAILLAAGLASLIHFFRQQNGALFPRGMFNTATTLGAGFTMVGCLAIATASFSVYGPLLLAALHGFSPLFTGYLIASESISWSILSIVLANTPPRRERAVIVTGACMIAAGIAGFALAIPLGSVPLILVCALLQGGGFGIAWPFITRTIIESAVESERTITVSAVPATQRIGYALGGALSGLIANAAGFAGGFTREAAQAAARPLFLLFLPVALLGCWAAWRATGLRA
jgi:MFS family permease